MLLMIVRDGNMDLCPCSYCTAFSPVVSPVTSVSTTFGLYMNSVYFSGGHTLLVITPLHYIPVRSNRNVS